MHSRKKKISALVSRFSIGVTSAAFAVSTFAAQAVLEEVIVEAQKKVETVTETPIAIQAMTGEQFQKYASFNLQDIARTTPGLAFETGTNTDIRLRGVSNVTLAAVSLRTNIYQDGALIEQPRAVFDTQYDIERFEVLKGPQGTLYGKSSPTGTINVRTKNPNLSEVEGYVAGSVGERNLYNTQFGINLPVIQDELAIRFAGVYDENQTAGLKNLTTGQESQSRGSGGRLTALWQPTDDLSARLSYQYREKKENAFLAVDGAGFNYDDDKLHTNVDDYNEYTDQLAILEVNYALRDNLSLISVTGYEDQDFINVQDTDGIAISPLSTGPFSSPAGSVQYTHIPLRPQWQQDLRIVSEDNDFWDWQVGFFYQRSATQTSVDVTQYNSLLSSFVGVKTLFQARQEGYAVYTHNTFKIAEDFDIIAGLRYQQARSNSSQPTTLATSAGTFDREGIPEDQQRKTFYPVTGTLKAQYFFNPDLMTYVTLDRAFRNGGANLNISTNLPPDFAGIDEESSNSIEVGLKGNFGDQRGRFAIAAYEQIYKNFQQDVENINLATVPSNISSMVESAKEAEARGVELNLDWLLQDNWSSSFNLAFSDSKFKDFDNAIASLNTSTGVSDCGSSPAPGKTYATCDLSGERLPMASRWAGNVTSNYSLPAFDGTDWYLNALVNFQSDQIDKVTRATLGGYSTVDIFTGLRSSEGGGWDVNLWVKNVFDRRVLLRVLKNDMPDITTGQTFDMVFTNTPRQVGVTGTYRF